MNDAQNKLVQLVALTLHKEAWQSLFQELLDAAEGFGSQSEIASVLALPHESMLGVPDMPFNATKWPPVTDKAVATAATVVAAVWPTIDDWWTPLTKLQYFDTAPSPQRFAECLALEAMGTGIGLIDYDNEWSHAELPEGIKVPPIDFMYDTVEDGMPPTPDVAAERVRDFKAELERFIAEGSNIGLTDQEMSLCLLGAMRELTSRLFTPDDEGKYE